MQVVMQTAAEDDFNLAQSIPLMHAALSPGLKPEGSGAPV
jgi:hypothetical protein